jgi:hypothetical protein
MRAVCAGLGVRRVSRSGSVVSGRAATFLQGSSSVEEDGSSLILDQSVSSLPAATRTERVHALFLDGAFVVLLSSTILVYVEKLRTYEFRGDDWRLFQRGSTPGDYFEPYNGHLSVVPIGVYRLLLEIFGLGSGLPLRLVALASLAAVAITMYFVVRSRVGPALGLVAAAEMLWSATLPLAPAAFNHWLALAAVIFCSWPLTRESPSGDIALGLALAFAFCSSGVAAAGAAACLVYTALSRAPLRRWLVVIGPTAAWAAWWLLASGERSRDSRSATESLDYLRHGVSASFRALAFGNRNLGVMLVALFAANLIWRLRKGPRNARHELSWCAALLVWWLGLAYSRQGTDALVFRYELVGSAFVILGSLPAHRPTWAGRELNSRGVVASAIVVAGLLAYENHNAIFGDAHRLLREGAEVRQQLVVANLGRDVVADGTRLPLVSAPAGVYRALTNEFGTPDGTSTTHPDARIVALGAIRPIETSRRPVGRCVAVGFSYLLPPTSTTSLRADSGDVHVRLRRFGSDWVSIGLIRDGTTSLIELPGLQASKPWILQAPGACLVRGSPTSTIIRPEDSAEVTGSTQLVAVTQNVYTTRLEFHLSGPGRSDTPIGNAIPLYGWFLRWDSTSVPNGEYALTSVVVDSAGNRDSSDAVRVTVNNRDR